MLGLRNQAAKPLGFLQCCLVLLHDRVHRLPDPLELPAAHGLGVLQTLPQFADSSAHAGKALFREFVSMSPFLSVEPWGHEPTIDESRRWNAMAHDRARELLANDTESPLTDDQIAEIDDIVQEAEARLREQGEL